MEIKGCEGGGVCMIMDWKSKTVVPYQPQTELLLSEREPSVNECHFNSISEIHFISLTGVLPILFPSDETHCFHRRLLCLKIKKGLVTRVEGYSLNYSAI